MSRTLWTLAGAVAVLLCIGGPLAFAFRLQAETRNFHVVKEGVLYRSGQITLYGLKNLLHDYRICTVVCLRDARVPGDPPPDPAEEKYCVGQEINYVRISPRHWESNDGGPAPVEEGVASFREVMRDPANYPVLVHCTAGIHRTGAYVAIYRMEFDHWTNERAIEELMAHGYYNLPEEKDILGYLRNYKPTWQAK